MLLYIKLDNETITSIHTIPDAAGTSIDVL